MSGSALSVVPRGHRTIRDLIREQDIIWDLEPVYIFNLAKAEIGSIRRQMQAWEDRYWRFVMDPRRTSDSKDLQFAYIEDVLTWYEMTRLERCSVSAELMEYWKRGVGLMLVDEHGFGDERWEGKPQMLWLYRQWRNLWEHYGSFCATYGDIKLLNPTSLTLPLIFESASVVRMPDFLGPDA